MSEIVKMLERTILYTGHGEASDLPEQAASHITALEARVGELEEALKPFAEFGEIMLPSDPTDNSPWATCSDETPVNNLAGQNISFGNFRAAARAALNQEKQK